MPHLQHLQQPCCSVDCTRRQVGLAQAQHRSQLLPHTPMRSQLLKPGPLAIQLPLRGAGWVRDGGWARRTDRDRSPGSAVSVALERPQAVQLSTATPLLILMQAQPSPAIHLRAHQQPHIIHQQLGGLGQGQAHFAGEPVYLQAGIE